MRYLFKIPFVGGVVQNLRLNQVVKPNVFIPGVQIKKGKKYSNILIMKLNHPDYAEFLVKAKGGCLMFRYSLEMEINRSYINLNLQSSIISNYYWFIGDGE